MGNPNCEEKTMPNLNRKSNYKGQGLVEYILLIFLMGLGCLSAMHVFRDNTKKGFNDAATNLTSELRTG
jgi:hypothetical protein